METHKGKSVPIVKEFQIEPILPGPRPRPRPIYEDGLTQAFYRDSEDYLSRFTFSHQQNQAQTLLSCSINSASEEQNTNLQRERAEPQRRGLEDYLPHWSSQGKRSIPMPWEIPFSCKNNGVRENNVSSMVENNNNIYNNNNNNNSNDPLAQFNMSFGDLLAMKGSAVEPSMVSTTGGCSTTSALFPEWDSQLQGSLFRNRERVNQQIYGVSEQEMQDCGFSHPYWNISDINSPLTRKHPNGKTSTFAPLTPDLRWRTQSNVGSRDMCPGLDQSRGEQNLLQEQEVAAAMVNLQAQEVSVPDLLDSSPGKVSMAMEENHNPDKGDDQGIIDLNKTPPQKKPRRKRYLPKVVKENKPKRTPKPKTPKPTDSKESPKVRRKYVRKNKTNTPSMTSPVEETKVVDPEPTEKVAKSCRKSLNFDLNGQEAENDSLHMSSAGPPEKPQPNAEEFMVKTSQGGIGYDLNHTLNQELKKYNSPPEKDNLEVQRSNSSPCASSNEGPQTRGSKRGNSCINDTTDVDGGDGAVTHSTFWQQNHTFLGNLNLPRILFPEICKKKRTEKGQRPHTSSTSSSATASEDVTQNHASKYYYCDPPPFTTTEVTNNPAKVLMGSVENRLQLLNTWADMARLQKKKRSKGPTRVRDPAALKGIISVSPTKQTVKGPRRKKSEISTDHSHSTANSINLSNCIQSCIEAINAETTAPPRSKRTYRRPNYVNSWSSNIDKVNNPWDLVLYNGNQSTRKKTGYVPALTWVNSISLEAITEGLKLLDINRESCQISCQEQNALVPYHANKKKQKKQNALVVYGKDGTIVPYEGPFDPIRKRRQRAKVDLDDETTRVWKLLLENIDNQGIDGTDEDKAKWWENERSVFRGRVDSFVARMRLVQGDRRFTPWKGSVLDSVIGVFLTQNVSDHLSSSAFMSLAAHFPLKSESRGSTLTEEETSALAVEPEVYVTEPEESITWIEKTLDEPRNDRNSRIIHGIDNIEEKEVVNGKEVNIHTTETEEASIQGDDNRVRDDTTSSQQSVISSQNSVSSPNFQTVGLMSTFSESNSRIQPPTTSSQSNYFDCSTSFMGLLKMAESPLQHCSQILARDRPESMNNVRDGSPEALGISSSNYQLPLKTDFRLQGAKYNDMLEVESRFSDMSRKDENSPPTEQSNLTTESTTQHLLHDKSSDCTPSSFAGNMCSYYVLEGEKMVIQSQKESMKEPLDTIFASSTHEETRSTWKSRDLPNSSQETPDVTESTTALERRNNDHKEVERISGVAKANPSKPRKVRPGKEKRQEYDNLRKQAQVNGNKRERTANTTDSLDWEAVRHADVREIADTIKERGMNNMLAERIKDLLDRLVEEHGSIDLEWLRDIPPDKAKEYLLSFRGLGLKSVECVRLLTLHHLAFPVDTNVGRIAVRLGWVPLQPLPESLQLHLLELYPVLESIQKYLWPRLCKLDQKTLYELHYHMITFGKVFCTKRQPNCNACPLRGECRHFASAFASARLSLPGPEERSIMAPTEDSSTHVNPQASIKPLLLPPSWGNYHTETNCKCNKDAPRIEIPSSPLPLSLPQTIDHLERRYETSKCEPIVEVPASPEPEPEPEQEPTLCDIEDSFYEDPNEIPTIKLNMDQFTQTLQNFMEANRELQEAGMSRALVALNPEVASIPTPKLKNINRLRTEHHVYELPDTHPLLKGLDKREPDDPCPYLLAIWTPGETADSIQPPERRCSSEDPNILCNEETCSYCSSLREVNSEIVRGTLLIPCRTAMRGSFPLNGTYFQVNELFADHDSSLNPIEVPRSWLWNLSRRTVYFGTSIPTIFRGLTTEDIQHCFWRGYVCVRGFDQKTRAPRPLMARLHFPASRMPRGAKSKANDE